MSQSLYQRPTVFQTLNAGDCGALSRGEILAILERREAILWAASLAAQKFLNAPWQNEIDQVLAELGRATDVSRVYVFQAQKGRFNQLFEWCAPDVAPEIENPAMQDFALEEVGLGRWTPILEKGRSISGHVRDFPDSEREFLGAQGIYSIAVLPILVDGALWGLVGFDECRAPREWQASDLETLRLFADVLGAAIGREKSENALRTSEGEMRALLGALRDAIIILDRDGRYLEIPSFSEALLFRPICELIGRTLDEVFPPEIATQFLGYVRRALAGETVQAQYSLDLPDGEVWFDATISRLDDHRVLWVARDVTEAKKNQLALQESEALFRLLTENATDKIARHRPDGSFIYVSPASKRLLGYRPNEMLQLKISDLVHPDDLEAAVALNRSLASHGEPDAGAIAYRMRHKSGYYSWFETSLRVIRQPHGEVLEIHSVTRDISERRESEEALRQAEAKYRSIFDNAIEGIFQTTIDGHYLEANASLARIYGFDSPVELVEKLTDISHQLYVLPHRREEFVREIQSKGAVAEFESQIYRKDGAMIWISENARAVRDETDDQILFFEGTVEDITKRKATEEQMLYDALHDKLTGLANRTLFMDRLGQAFARLQRHPMDLFGILFLDFDRFKNVNDSLGHQAGDQLLVVVAKRLGECLRPGDTVARLGGDEFAILLEDVGDVEGATLVAERIQITLAQPLKLRGQEIFSSASIGIALANSEYKNSEDLLRDADMAMYRAKALGKARHEIFDVGMHTRAVALLQLETDLRWAIERNEFRVFYQPIVDLKSGHIAGFEALVRWQHPERGLVSPGEFIPVAEETGWIVPIGNLVLEEACWQMVEWQKLLLQTPLTISVNLSSKQFSQPNLFETIDDVLKRTQLSPCRLKLEITESSLIERVPDVTERLNRLRNYGVRLALDDFGTGYSSLSYLHRFPLDTLKIDRSFVMNMNKGGENREIVRTIIAMGQNLGLDVVAEGVETAEQLAELRTLNCESGQGFFFSRPLPAEEVQKLLEKSPVW